MFYLKKAIKQWQKTLRKNEAFEDGYIAELESHLRDEIDNQISLGLNEEQAFDKAVLIMGQAESIGAEFYKTHTRHLSGRPPWKPPRFMPELLWNYVKVAIRKIKRHKGHSFINISGLAIGMTCCFIVFLWVKDELSFDKFHKNAPEIYRVLLNPQDTDTYHPHGPGPLGPTLKSDYPEIIRSTRYYKPSNLLVTNDHLQARQRIRGVDPDFFIDRKSVV